MKHKNKKIVVLLLIAVIGFCAILVKNFNKKSIETKEAKKQEYYTSTNESKEDVIYMSDLDYITDNNWSYNGWSGHNIQKDKNPEGGTISLLVNGNKKIFIKGMGVHADGQITYEIGDISSTYTRFIAKVGVDSSRDTNGSVKFKFLVSNDGNTWNELLTTDILRGNTESVDVDLNVANYKYFRIFVDKSVNGNAADHGVIAIAKFTKTDYSNPGVVEYDKLKNIEYYDNILNKSNVDYNLANNYELILKREIVRKIGYNEIQALTDYSSVYKDLFNWILSDKERMEQIIEVGEVNGLPFIKTLADLYENNKDTLAEADGNIYQKMMIGLAAAYSTDQVSSALQFSHKNADYDYLERFKIYKELYDDGSMTIYKKYFKNYHVELMRLVMSDGARNDEIKWLNYYTRSKNNNQSVYAYVNHTGTGVGYTDEEFHNLAYKDAAEEKYHLSAYGVPFGDNIQRYWMVIKKGGICWNQSRVFQSLFDSIGSPTIGAYQPSHEASFYYIANEDGTGKWNIANNIFGWGKTGTTWYGGNRFRTIFDWANKSFTNQAINSNSAGNSGGYVYLAQDNLNNYDKYKKSLYINLLANSYSDNTTKVNTYKKAIDQMNINLDSYDYLIKTYKEMDSITTEDWYQLALNIIDNYTYYPMAMNDMLKVIKPYLKNEKRVDIDNKEYQALESASKATTANVSHDGAAREIANVLLGSVDGKIASFSFDGTNKNKIVFNDMYKNYDMAWHYSLDGGATKSPSISSKIYELTEEEVKKINENDDILIYIDGLDINKPSYTIDITKKTAPGNYLYNNDLENKVIGVTAAMEWRIKGTDKWTSYRYEFPDLTGDKTIEVRFGASESAVASDYVSFDFTKDVVDKTKQYIPISYLNIHDVSTEATSNQGNAIFAIDGNYNTRWHSAWNGTDTKRYITIKLNKSVHLSQIEYVPAGGGNGRLIDGKVEGSIDGVNWFNLAEVKNLQYSGNQNDNNFGKNNIKQIETDSTQEVLYVKITATKASNGNWFTARMFNFYQDTTKAKNPTAGVRYSTTETTNGNVTATLIDYDKENVEILSAGGETHTFNENGEFEFIIMDKFTKNKTSINAKVNWIDKVKPVGKIKYSTTNKTNKSVIATLTANEEVEVLNNSEFTISSDGKIVNSMGEAMEGYTVDENKNIYDKKGNYIANIDPFKHEFMDNGEFTFEFVDKAGNKGTATAKVNWIDKEAPVATLEYDNDKDTDKDVTVKIKFDKSNVTILNNNGKNSYTFKENGEFTFEFVDQAGNHGSIIAKVNWINKDKENNNSNNNSDNNSNNNSDSNNQNNNIKNNNNSNSTQSNNNNSSSSKNNNNKENGKKSNITNTNKSNNKNTNTTSNNIEDNNSGNNSDIVDNNINNDNNIINNEEDSDNNIITYTNTTNNRNNEDSKTNEPEETNEAKKFNILPYLVVAISILCIIIVIIIKKEKNE